MPPADRRPLITRDAPWARAMAAALARRRVAPNRISALSLLFAGVGGAALAILPWVDHAAGRSALLIAAALAIQLRLLCNLLDGMVAVEGGLGSATGDLWNEMPDRVADATLLVGCGYAVAALPAGVALGWSAALLAAWTAYVRALGRGLGTPACFQGPLAKPQRMALLTAACAIGAGATPWRMEPWILWAALALIVVGTALTVARRLRAVAGHLRTRASTTDIPPDREGAR